MSEIILQQKTIQTPDKILIRFDHFQSGFNKLIVVAPGFYNSKESILLKTLAEELSRTYDVIVLDFRGHGRSSGFFTWTSKEYIDLLCLVDSLKGMYQKIGLIGFSMGAATGIIAASKTDLIHSLIAVAAPMDTAKIEYYFWGLDFENDICYSLFGQGRIGKGVRPGPFWLPKEKPINLVNHLRQPVFYIHGTKDWIVKSRHSQELFDKTNSVKRLKIIESGLHAEYLLRKSREAMISLIEDWFKETL